MLDLNSFLGISIVGVFLSLALEWIQAKYGVDSWKMRFLSVTLAIVVGSIYVLFSNTTWWSTVLGVLGAASTVYAMFFSGISHSSQVDA